MNYITSCPACETQFLLTKAHLKAYRGKVQCGHCEHIFNAKNRLTEVSDDIQNPDEYKAQQNETIDEEANADANINLASQASDDIDTEYAVTDQLLTGSERLQSSNTLDGKPISERLNGVLESVPNLSDLASAEELSNLPYIAGEYVDDYVPATDDAFSLDEKSNNDINAPIVIEDLTNDPNFSKTKLSYKNLQLSFLAVLLMILAILQIIYFNRTQIAAQYPQFKPLLTQACQAIQCQINLPQQLDLLTIDDSDMQESEDYQDVINFSSLLINKANYNQTYPNIELTLTDIADEPVLRRIVKPEEYLKINTDIVAGMAGSEEKRINIAINVHNIAVAGYRVLLVY